MVVKIKPGDMVRHRGEIARVMEIDTGAPDFRFRLSHFGWIDNQAANRLELVESIPNTTLKDGDEVVIRDISDDEKEEYGTYWVSAMNELGLSGDTYIVENVHYHRDYGWIGRIGDYTFQLYHVESVHNFDIV